MSLKASGAGSIDDFFDAEKAQLASQLITRVVKKEVETDGKVERIVETYLRPFNHDKVFKAGIKPKKGVKPKQLDLIGAIRPEIQAITDLQALGVVFSSASNTVLSFYHPHTGAVIDLWRMEGNEEKPPYLKADVHNLAPQDAQNYAKVLGKYGFKVEIQG